mgnify:CR=1 FL=1
MSFSKPNNWIFTDEPLSWASADKKSIPRVACWQWQKLLSRYRINTLVFPEQDSPIINILMSGSCSLWRPVILFIRSLTIPKNPNACVKRCDVSIVPLQQMNLWCPSLWHQTKGYFLCTFVVKLDHLSVTIYWTIPLQPCLCVCKLSQVTFYSINTALLFNFMAFAWCFMCLAMRVFSPCIHFSRWCTCCAVKLGPC